MMLAYLWLPYMILPIHAGLERLPDTLLDASADLGARTWPHLPLRWCCRWSCRPSPPDRSSRSRCSLGDYIAVQIVGGKTQLIGNLVYSNVDAEPAARRRARHRARGGHRDLPARGAPHRSPARTLTSDARDEISPRPARIALRIALRPRLRRDLRAAARWCWSTPSTRTAVRAGRHPASPLRLVGARLAQRAAHAPRCGPRSRPGSAPPPSPWCSARSSPFAVQRLPVLRPGDRLVRWSSCRSRCPASSPASR